MKKQNKAVLIISIVVIVIIIAIIAIIVTNRTNNKDNTVAPQANKENTTYVESKNNNITTQESNDNATTQENKNIATTGKVIKPLPTSLSINELKDCTFAANFNASDVYLNNDGALVVHMKVMVYETFDAVDISQMAAGDTLQINGTDIIVESIEREGKDITINGGLEEGGCYLRTDEDGLFYEILFNDARSYYSIGEATLPVDQEFVCEDNSDLANKGKTLYAGDFLQEMGKSKKEFVANATTVRVENGYIKNITINYIP